MPRVTIETSRRITAIVTESSTNVVPLVERFFSANFMAGRFQPRFFDLRSSASYPHLQEQHGANRLVSNGYCSAPARTNSWSTWAEVFQPVRCQSNPGRGTVRQLSPARVVSQFGLIRNESGALVDSHRVFYP